MVKFINFVKNGENGDQIKKFFQICDNFRSSFMEITQIAIS